MTSIKKGNQPLGKNQLLLHSTKLIIIISSSSVHDFGRANFSTGVENTGKTSFIGYEVRKLYVQCL